MKEIKKTKIYVVLAIAICILGILVFNIITNMSTQSYFAWLKANYIETGKYTMPSISQFSGYITAILGAAAYLLFWIFAIIYATSGNVRVQGRKWPFIVLIVFSSFGALINIFMILPKIGNIGINDNDLISQIDKDAMINHWDNNYQFAKIGVYISFAFMIGILAMSILSLVLIRTLKVKNEREISKPVLDIDGEVENLNKVKE